MNASEASSPATRAQRPANLPTLARTERFRLTGPSVHLDTRVHAVRKDIADISLASRIFAPHYAAPEHGACIRAHTPIRAEPSHASRAVSQLMRGDGFAVIDVAGDWAWGYSVHDNYVGYIEQAALGAEIQATHIVTSPAALLFAEADIKSPVLATLPIGARFAGVETGSFVSGDAGHVHLRHLRPLEDALADPVAVAERVIGAPYRWGGRGGDGFDCSGLVQAALALCGIAAPRDSDQQMAALGEPIAEGETLRRGDIVFFPGHVGFMIDADRLIHANAFWMAVTVEPLADVIARIDTETPVLARKRMARP